MYKIVLILTSFLVLISCSDIVTDKNVVDELYVNYLKERDSVAVGDTLMVYPWAISWGNRDSVPSDTDSSMLDSVDVTYWEYLQGSLDTTFAGDPLRIRITDTIPFNVVAQSIKEQVLILGNNDDSLSGFGDTLRVTVTNNAPQVHVLTEPSDMKWKSPKDVKLIINDDNRTLLNCTLWVYHPELGQNIIFDTTTHKAGDTLSVPFLYSFPDSNWLRVTVKDPVNNIIDKIIFMGNGTGYKADRALFSDSIYYALEHNLISLTCTSNSKGSQLKEVVLKNGASDSAKTLYTLDSAQLDEPVFNCVYTVPEVLETGETEMVYLSSVDQFHINTYDTAKIRVYDQTYFDTLPHFSDVTDSIGTRVLALHWKHDYKRKDTLFYKWRNDAKYTSVVVASGKFVVDVVGKSERDTLSSYIKYGVLPNGFSSKNLQSAFFLHTLDTTNYRLQILNKDTVSANDNVVFSTSLIATSPADTIKSTEIDSVIIEWDDYTKDTVYSGSFSKTFKEDSELRTATVIAYKDNLHFIDTLTITVKSYGPVVTIKDSSSQPVDTIHTYINDTISLHVEAIDSDGGTINGKTWSSENAITATNGNSCSYLFDTADDYTICVDAVDDDGITGKDSIVIVVSSGTPTLAGLPISLSGMLHGKLSFQGTISDINKNNSIVLRSEDGINFSDTVNVVSNPETEAVTVTIEEDIKSTESYSVWYRVVDEDNQVSNIAKVDITVDKGMPTCSLGVSANVIGVNDGIVVTAFANDPNSNNDLLSYKWSTDGTNYSLGSKTYTISSGFSSSGIHNIYSKVTDPDGYSIENVASVEVHSYGPSLSGNNISAYLGDSVTFDVTVQDSNFNTMTLYWLKSDNTLLSSKVIKNDSAELDSTFNVQLKLKNENSSGVTIRCVAVDDDGLSTDTLTLECKTITSNPIINSVSPDDTLIAGGESTDIVISAFDPNDRVLTYMVSEDRGVTWESSSNSTVKKDYTLPVGSAGVKMFYVKVKNSEGLESDIDSVQLTFNGSVPSVALKISPEKSSYKVGEVVQITAEAQDDASGGIVGYEITVNGAKVSSGASYSHTLNNAGTHKVVAKVTDNLGATTNSDTLRVLASLDDTKGISAIKVNKEDNTTVKETIVASIDLYEINLSFPYYVDLSSIVLDIDFDGKRIIYNNSIVLGPTTKISLFDQSSLRVYADDGTDLTYTINVSQSPFPDTVYVRKNAIGTNTGESWDNAFSELSEALKTIDGYGKEGINVWISAGIYIPKYKIDLSLPYNDPDDKSKATFYVHNDMRLYGGFQGWETSLSERNYNANVTVLSGDIENDVGHPGGYENNAYHVVSIEGPTAILDGLNIREGYADNASDGLKTVDGKVKFTTDGGAGIFINGPNVTVNILNCILSDNYASDDGAGVYIDSNNKLSYFSNSTFSSNDAGGHGGAIYSYKSYLKMKNCDFSSNKPLSEPDGIYIKN